MGRREANLTGTVRGTKEALDAKAKARARARARARAKSVIPTTADSTGISE